MNGKNLQPNIHREHFIDSESQFDHSQASKFGELPLANIERQETTELKFYCARHMEHVERAGSQRWSMLPAQVAGAIEGRSPEKVSLMQASFCKVGGEIGERLSQSLSAKMTEEGGATKRIDDFRAAMMSDR